MGIGNFWDMAKTALIFYQGDFPAGGMWRYGYMLAKGLVTTDKENQYSLIHARSCPENFIGLEPYEKLLPLKWWQKIIFLPKILRRQGFNVVHVTENACPFFINAPYKKIVTVHDLMPLGLSYSVNLSTKLYYKFYLPWALSKVDKIVTVSQYSK